MGEKIKIFISANQEDLSSKPNQECFKDFMKLLEIFFSRFFNRETIYGLSYETKGTVKINEADIVFAILTQHTINNKHADALNDYVDKNNIYKLLFNDIPKQNQPKILQNLVNYYFYVFDNDENRIFDFFELHEKNNTLFNNKIINLGYDIIHYLNTKSAKKELDPDPKKNIYLSYTGVDQANNRELIKRELQNRGYNVLPKNLQFDDIVKLEKDIIEQLSKSSLAIHILGEDNFSLPGGKTTLVELQNKLAIEQYNKMKNYFVGQNEMLFSRIIWLPNDLTIADESHQIWLENFIQSAETQIGSELIETPIETLKTIIEEKLHKKEGSEARMMENASNTKHKVYVLYEYKNKEEADKINAALQSLDIQPVFTAYNKDYLSVIENHRNNLIEADSVLILYYNTNPDWLNSKLMDVKKSPGFGRRKSFDNKVIIHTDTLDQKEFDISEYALINTKQNFNEALAKIFAKPDTEK